MAGIADIAEATFQTHGQTMFALIKGKAEGGKVGRVRQPDTIVPFKGLIVVDKDEAAELAQKDGSVGFLISGASRFVPSVNARFSVPQNPMLVNSPMTEYTITAVDRVNRPDSVALYKVRAVT